MDRRIISKKDELTEQYKLVTDFIKYKLGENYTAQSERMGIKLWEMKSLRAGRGNSTEYGVKINQLLDAYGLTLDRIRNEMPMSLISEEVAEKDKLIKKLKSEINDWKDRYIRAMEQRSQVESQ